MFHGAGGLVAPGAIIRLGLSDPMHVGGQGWVVTASQASQVDSVRSGERLLFWIGERGTGSKDVVRVKGQGI